MSIDKEFKDMTAEEKLEMIEANGCLDGDCPHDHYNQCYLAFGKYVFELFHPTQPKCQPQNK